MEDQPQTVPVHWLSRLWPSRSGNVGSRTGFRVVPIQGTPVESDRHQQFIGNRISNTKYTLLTFLPLNIMEQFSRFMNQYFLLIACLQLISTITPISPVTTWTPLLIIFSISAGKEALDDFRRYRDDQEANERPCWRLDPVSGRLVSISSHQVQVGDVLKVNQNREFPADMVMLTSSESDGSCYVQTSNLDGETDLKPRQAILATCSLTMDDLARLKGVIECPHPNSHIYSFDATLCTDLPGLGGSLHSLDSKQLLIQGTFLRNTSFIYGVVVYTGGETKLGMNKSKPGTKWTKLDREIDRISRIIFIAQLCVTIAFGVVGNIFAHSLFVTHHYVDVTGESSQWYDYLIIPARMMLLLSFSIPISLKVSLDMIKYVAALFIGWDIKMYDEVTDTPAHAASTAIAEDLGQIEYLFTDKTGTLTDNKMVFKRCSIDGVAYGFGDQGALSSLELRSTLHVPFHNPFSQACLPAHLFFLNLAICHTVTRVEQMGKFVYQGSSPDEEEFAMAAAVLGVVFISRNNDIITISVEDGRQVLRFRLLNMLEFTSDRKRMSVLVDMPDCPGNDVLLFTKGADDVIMSVCNRQNTDLLRITCQHIDEFASQGFRTLSIAYRSISRREYQEWNRLFQAANTSLDDRDSKVRTCYQKLECELDLLGATAIEDRLQKEVPETIKVLRNAGIRIWMLTGDKRATAVEVAKNCSLLPLQSELLHIDGHTKLWEELKRSVDDCFARALAHSPLSSTSPASIRPVTVVIDGLTLEKVLERPETTKSFVELGLICQSVICCRVSPRQKSMVVQLIKERNYITLAIGDGGNDVSMIQRAHIGVGIKGREGFQAARAADYSIAQFRFLRRLVLVHGRYGYKRSAFLALYCFYKSIFICMIQALYEFLCGFSGTSFLDTFALSTYSVMWTALPVLFFSLDRDIEPNSVFRYPQVYQESVKGYAFNGNVFLGWLARAGFQSTITLFGALLFFSDDSSAIQGVAYGELNTSISAYTICILIQTVTMVLESSTLTWPNLFVIFATLFVYLLTLLVCSFIRFTGLLGVAVKMFGNPTFWLAIILITCAAMLPVFVYKYYRFNYTPYIYQVIQYLQSLRPSGSSREIEMRVSSIEVLNQTYYMQHGVDASDNRDRDLSLSSSDDTNSISPLMPGTALMWHDQQGQVESFA